MLSRHFPAAQLLLPRRTLVCTAVAFSLFQLPSAHAQNSRGLQPVAPAPPALAPGSYYALVIGIDSYPSLPHLTTAVSDAKAVGALLESDFGFGGHVTYLLDQRATRAGIMDALEGPGGYGQTLSESDNLLIYYAGHGYDDTRTDKAYWLPYDADSPLSANHVSADDLTTAIRGIASRHVLIISDSCYSGDLDRGVDDDVTASRGEEAFLHRMLAAPSRNLLSSGGNEPVSDAGPEGHSIFASALLRALADQPGPLFTAADLADPVKKMVREHSGQIPEYFRIGNSMPRSFPIDIGDFVFTRPAAYTAHPLPTAPTGTPITAPHADESSPGLALLKTGNYRDAASAFTAACNGGSAAGCGELGQLFEFGNGVSKDASQAATLYRKSCDGGFAEGCDDLGRLYEDGRGVAKDRAQAGVFYRRACESGFTSACDRLGQDYEDGKGGARNYTEAAAFFRRACDQGEAKDCNSLGALYEYGLGVAKDPAQAAALYGKACDSGYARGCTDLGKHYEYGLGVAKNSYQATALYRKACEAGDSEGCETLKDLNRAKP